MSDRISGLLVVVGALFFLWAYNSGRWNAIARIITGGPGEAGTPGNSLINLGGLGEITTSGFLVPGTGLGLANLSGPGQRPGAITAKPGTGQYWDQVAAGFGTVLSGGNVVIGQAASFVAQFVQNLLGSHCSCDYQATLNQYSAIYKSGGLPAVSAALQQFASGPSGWLSCDRQCSGQIASAIASYVGG